MLLDLFTIKYKVDAADAEKDIDRIGEKAKKTRQGIENNGKKGTEGLEQAGNAARKAMEDAGSSAERATAKIDRLKEGALRIKGIIGQLGDVGTMVKTGGWWGAASAASRMDLGGMMPKKGPPGGSGGGSGGGGGIIPAGGSEGAAGMARAAVRALGGPVAIIGAVTAALGAAAVWGVKSGHTIAKASEEKYGQVKRQAWDAGMTTQSLLTNQIAGEKLGISREQMLSGLRGLNEKIKEVALHRAQPMGGIDMKTGIDTNPLSRLFRARGITIQKGKHLESMDKIWKVIVDDLRTAAEKQGTNYALARATQQYGLDFEQASKIINASSEAVRGMTDGIKQQAIQETILAQVTKNYSNTQSALKVEQEKTELQIRAKVVPGMVAWSKETVALEKNMRPLWSVMAELKRIAIDLSTGALSWLNASLEAAANLGEKIKNLPETINEGAASLGKSFNNMIVDVRNKIPSMMGGLSDEEAAQQKSQIDASYKAEADMRKKDRDARAAQQAKEENDRAASGRKLAFDAYEKERGKKLSTQEKEKYGPLIDQMVKDGQLNESDDQQMLAVMQTVADDQKKGMEANDAQFQVEKEKLSQIVVNTSVGLEQALAMWAGGIGRAGGLGTATFEGQSRSDFERRSKQTRFMPDPQVMRLGASAAETAQRKAGYMEAPKAMDRANSNANQGMRINEQSRMGAANTGNRVGGDLNMHGDIIVQAQTDKPQDLGTAIGRGVTDMMGGWRKEIANTFDSVFKA